MPEDLIALISEPVRPSRCHTQIEEEFDAIDLDDFNFQASETHLLHEENHAYR